MKRLQIRSSWWPSGNIRKHQIRILKLTLFSKSVIFLRLHNNILKCFYLEVYRSEMIIASEKIFFWIHTLRFNAWFEVHKSHTEHMNHRARMTIKLFVSAIHSISHVIFHILDFSGYVWFHTIVYSIFNEQQRRKN